MDKGWSAGKRILVATAIAGTLDILAAVLLTLAYGRAVPGMLRYVASGPFPDAVRWGDAGAALGLGVHYALMAVMAAAFILAADRFPRFKQQPVVWGLIYGIDTYIAMNLIVVPLRFGTWPSATGVATQLFCHLLLVGLPIAFVARRG